PRGCRKASDSETEKVRSSFGGEFVRPGPTFRPASLLPAGQAGRRQFGSDRGRRQHWKLETVLGRVTGRSLALACIRVPRLSPIGNRRNRPAATENAANFFRSSTRARGGGDDGCARGRERG